MKQSETYRRILLRRARADTSRLVHRIGLGWTIATLIVSAFLTGAVGALLTNQPHTPIVRPVLVGIIAGLGAVAVVMGLAFGYHLVLAPSRIHKEQLDYIKTLDIEDPYEGQPGWRAWAEWDTDRTAVRLCVGNQDGGRVNEAIFCEVRQVPDGANYGAGKMGAIGLDGSDVGVHMTLLLDKPPPEDERPPVHHYFTTFPMDFQGLGFVIEDGVYEVRWREKHGVGLRLLAPPLRFRVRAGEIVD